MPLDKDNPGHRAFSDWMDGKMEGGRIYDRVTRPIVHGAYHAGQYMASGNDEKWARSKDQFRFIFIFPLSII